MTPEQREKKAREMFSEYLKASGVAFSKSQGLKDGDRLEIYYQAFKKVVDPVLDKIHDEATCRIIGCPACRDLDEG